MSTCVHVVSRGSTAEPDGRRSKMLTTLCLPFLDLTGRQPAERGYQRCSRRVWYFLAERLKLFGAHAILSNSPSSLSCLGSIHRGVR